MGATNNLPSSKKEQRPDQENGGKICFLSGTPSCEMKKKVGGYCMPNLMSDLSHSVNLKSSPTRVTVI